jgi:hypothetical protein
VVDLTCQHKNQTLLVEGSEIKIRPVGADSWSLHDRFSAEDIQAVVDLYISGATSSQVAPAGRVVLVYAGRADMPKNRTKQVQRPKN